MKVKVTVDMFSLPNFLRIAGVSKESGPIDVGHMFPTDADATEFWESCREQWVDHVAKRRESLTEHRPPKEVVAT